MQAEGNTGVVNQQHSALELQIPCPARSGGQNPPMRSDRVLLGELTGASHWILVAPAGTRKAIPLVEIRSYYVGCCDEMLPAQGLCHRSLFEEIDLGSCQDSLCFMVVLSV
jgi:hypothetical protein